MAQTTLNPVHQLSIGNVRRCGRFLAHFLLRSTNLSQVRLADLPINRLMNGPSTRAFRRELSDRYVRRHTPSRLLGWR